VHWQLDLRRPKRKAKLDKILSTADPGVRLNEHCEGDGAIVFKHACKLRWESHGLEAPRSSVCNTISEAFDRALVGSILRERNVRAHAERSDRYYTPRLMTDAIHAMAAEIARIHGEAPIDALALSLAAEFLARAATEMPHGFRSIALVSPTGFDRNAHREQHARASNHVSIVTDPSAKQSSRRAVRARHVQQAPHLVGSPFHQRGTPPAQISIAERAAQRGPTKLPKARFRPLEVFGRRPPEFGHAPTRPASEGLSARRLSIQGLPR
jgi:hypothetical protein